MPNTKKLLSITNLKKYFPIAKSNIFQKEQLYVRANEDITLDIFEGETLGIVGESGCGKSTLGRVLLQLYEQTAGTTVYYGMPRSAIAPGYVLDTLKNVDKYVARLKKAKEHADAMTAKVESAGENATFFDHQNKNLADAEYETALAHVAKILGGFLVKDTKKGASLLYKKAQLEDSAAKIAEKIGDLKLELDLAGEASLRRSKSSTPLSLPKKSSMNPIRNFRSMKRCWTTVSTLHVSSITKCAGCARIFR